MTDEAEYASGDVERTCPESGIHASSPRSKLVLLVALLAVGVGLAFTGNALGVSEPLSEPEPGALFAVSDENVTVTASGQEVTAVEKMDTVTNVEITEQDGQFLVTTDREAPFTSAEMQRGIEIAKENKTVQAALDRRDTYEFEVEPVHKLEASELAVTTINDTNVTFDTATEENESRSVDTTTTDHESGANRTAAESDDIVTVTVEDNGSNDGSTVRVDREPSYVEDRAVVVVRDPEAGERVLSAVVDLQSEQVVSLTDWRDVTS